MKRKSVMILSLFLGLLINLIILFQSETVSANSYEIPSYIMNDIQKNTSVNKYNGNSSSMPTTNYQYQNQINYNRMPVNSYTVSIPANLVVPFQIQGNYSSKNLTPNTRISAIVSNDVFYNNIIVFRKGTVGYLYPSYVNKAGRFGDQAKIDINSVTFQAIDGREQTLSVDYSAEGKNVVYGLSAGFFSKNKETELNSGMILYGKTINQFLLNIK